MCGLTALIGTDVRNVDVLAFQKLAQLSALRGQDSVGFFDFHLSPTRNEKECKYYKELGSAGLYFGEGGRWDNSFFWPRYHTKKNAFNPPVVLVAHARAATKGSVTKNNAHPFVHGHLIGVHNGTIHSDFEGKEKFETDSEALYSYMSKHGEQKGLDMVNQLSNAAYALLWVNLKEKTFNIARNQDRPLFFSKHKHKDVCFLSSDDVFLKAVLKYVSNDYSTPTMVPKEDWIVFEINKRDILKTQEVVPIKEQYVQTFPNASTSHHGNQSVIPFPRASDSPPKNSNNASVSGQNKSPTWTDSDILADELTEEDVPHRMRRINPEESGRDEVRFEIRPGVTVNFQEISKLLSYGCETCNKRPYSYEIAYFFKDRVTYLCDNCSSDVDNVRMVAEDVKTKLEAANMHFPKPTETEPVVCH